MDVAANIWPPAYDGVSDDAAAPGLDSGGGSFPPPTWPSLNQLRYTKEAVTTTLLLLALPWLAWKLLTNPGYVLAGAGRQHIKRSA